MALDQILDDCARFGNSEPAFRDYRRFARECTVRSEAGASMKEGDRLRFAAEKLNGAFTVTQFEQAQ